MDFFAPGVEQIGGYSICSTPKKLEETGAIDLVVNWPPLFIPCDIGIKTCPKPVAGRISHDLTLNSISGKVGIHEPKGACHSVADLASHFAVPQVKQSRYPPAVWIHNDAKPGSEVALISPDIPLVKLIVATLREVWFAVTISPHFVSRTCL